MSHNSTLASQFGHIRNVAAVSTRAKTGSKDLVPTFPALLFFRHAGLDITPLWCSSSLGGKAKANLRPSGFKAVFAHADKLNMTVTAVRTAAALGFGRAEIVATIQTMQRAQFYKSMTSYKDHRIWQDVYLVPSDVGTLYVKFTADVLSKFLLLSFKEKDNG